jgi:outer membrane receptor protein involved in Fe transport
MKNYSLFAICLMFTILCQGLSAQNITIRGSVVESRNNSPVEFATVVLTNSSNDMIDGTTTDKQGAFQLESSTENFIITVSFIGFSEVKITDYKIVAGTVDLGTIRLSEEGQRLEEIVVRAEKSQTEFKLDKRVFNVGQDLSTTGASALELLNNVPSVNVSIEGQVSLRGSSGVQILINGKPSVLASDEGNALGTITAEMIESIEVITNPSAKYEAEGTAGIINIIIKKEERRGLNGSVTLNTGTPDNHSVGLSLNRRTEKFNLFSQLGVGYRELPENVENINTDFLRDRTVSSIGKEFRNEAYYNIILGTDYYFNDWNVLTLSGNYALEIEDQPSLTNFDIIQDGNLVNQYFRDETTEATNPKWQYELVFKRDFKDHEDHDLVFSGIGNFFGKAQSSDFANITTFGAQSDSFEKIRTDFSEAKYTFQLDYIKSIGEKLKFETGGQYLIQIVSNDFEVANLIDDVFVSDPGLTNIFEYDQRVMGLYSTGAYEEGNWGIKAGLRVETTILNTLLKTTGEENDQNYISLFPSLHSSYKLTERLSFQASYSRRIFRPRLWDLNPFFNIRNNFSIRTGNPELLPEFTDSYELSGIYILEKISLSLGVYHRYTTDVVERISTFENNVNTFKPVNIGVNRSTGIELISKYTPADWVVLNGDINYNFFEREGRFEGNSFDFRADQWSAQLTSKFKLPADLDIECTANYRSAFQTVQRDVSANLFADFGLRKKIIGGKAVVSISVRDVFFSRFDESRILQDDFSIYSFEQRGRFITAGFSYGFGKGEAMEYTGKRR